MTLSSYNRYQSLSNTSLTYTQQTFLNDRGVLEKKVKDPNITTIQKKKKKKDKPLKKALEAISAILFFLADNVKHSAVSKKNVQKWSV